ncbi:MAG: SsgA family sporulation/cell division regulator [Streptosporangiaceae bacterium]
MKGPGSVVSRETDVDLVLPEGTRAPLRASLRYAASDPYAIHMTFQTGPSERVEWVFARELLAIGAVRPAGDGDVRVWPDGEDPDRRINLSLSSPYGSALFELSLPQVAEFLRDAYAIVPGGTESAFIDVDAALRSLLRGSV